MARVYVRTDKNGTKIYHDDTCRRCDGRGNGPWFPDGGTCWECGGTGHSKVRVIKEYTPEYRAKLDERAQAKAQKKREEIDRQKMENAVREDAAFIQKEFFGKNEIFIIKGNTFDIREVLKNEGCKFHNGIAWYSGETERPAWRVGIDRLTNINRFGIHAWKAYDELDDLMKNLIAQDRLAQGITSVFQGNIGDRLELNVEVISSIRIERERYTFYDSGFSFLNKMKDEAGNIYLWKTDRPLSGNRRIKGTVKEHKEYEGVQETILSRCKIISE